jgi:hypothetical protein
MKRSLTGLRYGLSLRDCDSNKTNSLGTHLMLPAVRARGYSVASQKITLGGRSRLGFNLGSSRDMLGKQFGDDGR